MDIVIAAEKTTIAQLLADHIRRRIRPEDISVTENPDETGSFYIDLEFDHYKLTPGGKIVAGKLVLLD